MYLHLKFLGFWPFAVSIQLKHIFVDQSGHLHSLFDMILQALNYIYINVHKLLVQLIMLLCNNNILLYYFWYV